MRVASSLVTLALYFGFTAAAAVPNVGEISTRDSAVSQGRLSRRFPDDTVKNIAGVVETVKRDDGLGEVLEQLLENLGTLVDDLLAGDHL